jgi:hypothetical protein
MAINPNIIAAESTPRKSIPVHVLNVLSREPTLPQPVRDTSVYGGYRWQTLYPVRAGHLICVHDPANQYSTLYVGVADSLGNMRWKRASLSAFQTNAGTGRTYDPLATLYSSLAN